MDRVRGRTGIGCEKGWGKGELKVHKCDNFLGFDFEICTFS